MRFQKTFEFCSIIDTPELDMHSAQSDWRCFRGFAINSSLGAPLCITSFCKGA